MDILKFHAKNKSYSSLEHLFRVYYKRLCYYASEFVGNIHEAEDIVQDSFIKFWNRKTEFSDERSVKNFLYVTVKNACLNTIRHNQVVQKHENEETKHNHTNANEVLNLLIKAEVLNELYHAIDSLPEGCQKIFKLSYFEELRNGEIADLLNVSINTVKTQKYRALHLLRQKLKKIYDSGTIDYLTFLILFNFF